MGTWIGIAAIAWVAVSIIVSLAVGGMIRIADSRRLASPLDAEKVRQLRHAPQHAQLRQVS